LLLGHLVEQFQWVVFYGTNTRTLYGPNDSSSHAMLSYHIPSPLHSLAHQRMHYCQVQKSGRINELMTRINKITQTCQQTWPYASCIDSHHQIAPSLYCCTVMIVLSLHLESLEDLRNERSDARTILIIRLERGYVARKNGSTAFLPHQPEWSRVNSIFYLLWIITCWHKRKAV